MAEILWNPGKAAEIGNLQGQMTGFIAGAYSLPGMANISAAPTEVLNQNGYTIYQDDTTGHYNLKRDNNPNSDSIWTSQTMGVTFDCSGDTLSIKGINEEDVDGNKGGSGSSNTATNASSFGLVTSASNFDYGTYTDNARSSFAQTSQNVLNRLGASQNSGVTYSSTAGLNTTETIDPVTRAVVDKEKSAAIDEMNMSEATKHKFDNIAKLIYKVSEKQSTAEVEAKDKSGDCAIVAGAVGATALSVGTGAKLGAAIGHFIPIPFAGAIVGAAVGAGVG